MAYEPIHFRPGERLGKQLDQRTRRLMDLGRYARHRIITQRDLDRYYGLLERELLTLPLTMTDLEACHHALSGLSLQSLAIDNLAGIVTGSAWAVQHLTDGYRDALVRKLLGLTPGQRYALADLVERASDACYPEIDHDIPTRLRALMEA